MSRMHVFVGAVAALGDALSTSSAAAQPRLPTGPTTAPAGSPTAPAGAAPLGGAVSVEDQVVKLIAGRDVCRATACGGPKATSTCTPVAACETAFRAAVTAIGKWPSYVRIAPRRAVAGQKSAETPIILSKPARSS